MVVYICAKQVKTSMRQLVDQRDMQSIPHYSVSRPSAHTAVLMHWDTNPRSCVVAQSSQSLERRRVPPFWTHAPLSEALPG